MALVSVSAIYDGEQIRLLEAPPVHEPYHVLVTFVEPVGEQEAAPANREAFWASFGAWQDSRPAEATLEDIHQARRSKKEPQASETAHSSTLAEVGEPLTGDELATLLEAMDNLPLESDPVSDLSTTYRETLYPKHGKIP